MITKPKGYPKTGGRKRGECIADKLRAELNRRKIDLVNIFFSDFEHVAEPLKRCELMLKFMEFVYPKPRIDVAVSVKDMDQESFKEMMRDGVARIRAERSPS